MFKASEVLPDSAWFHVEEEEWNEMKEAVYKIKTDIVDGRKEMDLIKDFKKKLNNFEILLDDTLSKREFEEYKQMNENSGILNVMTKKFADRNEVFKNLRRMEKRFQTIESTIEKESSLDGNENALLSKMQFGSLSCASCRKDLGLVQGTKAPYCSWNKLPKRNATERIANVYYCSYIL